MLFWFKNKSYFLCDNDIQDFDAKLFFSPHN